MNAERPPLSQILIYAMGQLGWSLAAFGAGNLLVYFYMPPGTGSEAFFPPFIYQGALLGLVTVVGLINFGGRIFDAFTDPVVARWSDRLPATGPGRRLKMMAIAALPLAILSFLIFYPISPVPSALNTVWLILTLFLFYLSLTAYVIPYTALIGELGHHPGDRMLISTLLSVAWALGFLLGSNVYALQEYFERILPPVQAFQSALGIFGALSLVFLIIPVLKLEEKRYAYQRVSQSPTLVVIRSVLRNGNFRFFLGADLMYWLSLTFIQLGIGFYVTILFQMEKHMASVFLGIGFLGSFLLYFPVNLLEKSWGKRNVLILAFLIFIFIFGLTTAIPSFEQYRRQLFFLLAGLSAFPLAAFGIIPNALIADVIYRHEARTGEPLAAMFFAARNFTMKMGISLANLLFPSLLLLGKSTGNDFGVRLSSAMAVLFCLAGLWLFGRFRDKSRWKEEGELADDQTNSSSRH